MRRSCLLLSAALGLGSLLPLAAPLVPAAAAQTWSDEAAVRRAFRSVVGRDPSAREVNRYGRLMQDYGWSEADVRADLRDRVDYRRYTGTNTAPVDRVIRRAYEDILGRSPDAEGLSHYRARMLQEGWTEYQVREALRASNEYNSRRGTSADGIIQRAYNDILRRDPDAAGLAHYRERIYEDGWDEHDVRQALRRSPERREVRRAARPVVSAAEATEMVRRSYRSVLEREPDESGLESYRRRILDEGWTEAQVVEALRQSEEYRNRR